MTRLRAIITLSSMSYLRATSVYMFGTILSEHTVASFANSAIVTFKALPHSKERILHRAGLVACRPGRPLHCSSVSSVFSEFDTWCFVRYNFNTVLRSASTKLMIRRMWIFFTPAFFLIITSMLFTHWSFLNPCMNRSLIVTWQYWAIFESNAMLFQNV